MIEESHGRMVDLMPVVDGVLCAIAAADGELVQRAAQRVEQVLNVLHQAGW